MAEVPDLTAASALTGSELVHVVQSSNSRKATAQDIADLAGTGISINAQTGTTYTLVLGDAGKLVTMDNASANTLTIPPNASVAFPTGTQIAVKQIGAGTTTVEAGSGVTLDGTSTGSCAIDSQWNTLMLTKLGTDAWTVDGPHGGVS